MHGQAPNLLKNRTFVTCCLNSLFLEVYLWKINQSVPQSIYLSVAVYFLGGLLHLWGNHIVKNGVDSIGYHSRLIGCVCIAKRSPLCPYWGFFLHVCKFFSGLQIALSCLDRQREGNHCITNSWDLVLHFVICGAGIDAIKWFLVFCLVLPLSLCLPFASCLPTTLHPLSFIPAGVLVVLTTSWKSYLGQFNYITIHGEELMHWKITNTADWWRILYKQLPCIWVLEI